MMKIWNRTRKPTVKQPMLEMLTQNFLILKHSKTLRHKYLNKISKIFSAIPKKKGDNYKIKYRNRQTKPINRIYFSTFYPSSLFQMQNKLVAKNSKGKVFNKRRINLNYSDPTPYKRSNESVTAKLAFK